MPGLRMACVVRCMDLPLCMCVYVWWFELDDDIDTKD
jgi:hypothetical protein